MPPKVAIIILNWNGKQWLKPCIDSVMKTEYEKFNVYVVDNGSTDGSQLTIRDKYPSVTLIQNHKNLGFAEGNNVGIRRALKDGADYIMLLNQDTKVDPGWLSQLVEAAEADPSLGILSPMQWDYEGENLDINFQHLLRNQTNYEEDLQNGKLQALYESESVIGAGMMMSRSVCEQVGLFDPLYFIYGEETDLCRRARFHGFRIAIDTRSIIYHHHSLIQHKSRPYRFVRNQALFFWKNPDRTTLDKISIYIRWGGAKSVASDSRWPKDFRHRLLIANIHLWLFTYLPLILWRTYKEQRGACYLS